MRLFKLSAILTCALSIFLPHLSAQGTSGTIVGTVKDASGAVVAGASVTVRNTATNAARKVVTGADGEYTVPLLPPGVYEVTATQTGFRNAVYTNIGLEVNQTARVDATLAVGSQTEQVEVTSAAPLVQTDTSSLGQVVNQQSVSTLPLNQRNFVSFAYLVPGVQLPAEGSLDSTQGLAMSVNGARETANNFLIDGIDDNDLVINQYSAIPSLDAIQEFKVQSGNYTAEYGRSGGAQVNVLIKSGTNAFHGTAYEFVRNRHMDAKNYFDQPDCTPTSVPGTCSEIPRLDRSQFGGSFGGPIVKDKTFFFIAYEYLNLRDAATRQATVPSQLQRQQALAAVPPSLVNPAGLNIFNLYPAANVGTNLLTSNTFVSAPTASMTEPYGVAKIDQRLSEKDNLSGHYVLSFGDAFNPFDPLSPYTNLPGYATTVLTHGQNGGVDWTHIFTPKILNEARVGFNRELGDFEQADKTDYNTKLGFPTVLTDPIDLGFPNVAVAGFDGIGQPTNTPQVHPTYTLHALDNFAWNPSFDSGRHQLKFGFEYRYYWYSILFDTTARGIWTFNGGPGNSQNPNKSSLVQLLLGTPDVAQAVNSGVDMDIRAPSYDLYVQDDYHVSPKLTVNMGLRWEFNVPPYEVDNHFSAPDLSPASATCTPKPSCEFIVAGTNGLPRATYNPDYHNFDPRVGLAWRPLNSDRLVIRTAYGIFTDIVVVNANLNLRFNPPFRFTQVIQNPQNTATIQNILSQPASVTPPTATFFDRNYRDAYMQQWNFDVQYELVKNLLLDVGYVGSRGVHLPGNRNVNQPNVGQPVPYPQFGPTVNMIDNSRDSTYNALQVRIEKRSARGGSFLTSYTFSRCIDDGSTLFGALGGGTTPQYAQNLQAERGLCNFNANQRLVFSYVYELPMGAGHAFLGSGFVSHIVSHWQLSGILALQSGQPFTISRGVPQSGTLPTGSSDRPNVVGNPLVAGPVAANPSCAAPSQVGIPTMWFNPCAFVAAPGQFGNVGRDNMIGPGYYNLDFSLLKDVVIREDKRIQLRAETFNIFNHPNFDLPNHNFDSKTFGFIQSANAYGGRPPRQIQLGVKFIF